MKEIKVVLDSVKTSAFCKSESIELSLVSGRYRLFHNKMIDDSGYALENNISLFMDNHDLEFVMESIYNVLYDIRDVNAFRTDNFTFSIEKLSKILFRIDLTLGQWRNESILINIVPLEELYEWYKQNIKE